MSDFDSECGHNQRLTCFDVDGVPYCALCKVQSLRAKLEEAVARNITLRRLLDTACDAWECGMTVTGPDGIVLADFKAACLPYAWYERSKKEVSGGN